MFCIFSKEFDSFANTKATYKSLLTVLITIDYGELLFSNLKHFKYLKASMSQEKLHG